MIFSKSTALKRLLAAASIFVCWCVAQIVCAQELVQLPPVEDDYSHEIQVDLFSSPQFPVQQCAPICASAPPLESPKLFDNCLEALPRLLSCPNKPCGNFFSALLHSPRFEVPTYLDACPHGIHPIPERPPLLFECGELFLGDGPLKPGIETPFGAVWRPAIWVFGEYRSAIQYTDYGPQPVTEWANRLDLFGQLNLSGTERLLLGMRPLDEELSDRRRFSSIDLREGGTIDGLNAQIQTLFFEGDFGEIFPNLDPFDIRHLDYGFSVGRMPLLAQQGLLINEDRLDAITVTRNTLFTKRILNLRMTGVYAWDSINRNSPDFGIPNTEDNSSQLVALLTESDFAKRTVNADIVYVDNDTPSSGLIAIGVSGIQRIKGYYNTYNTSLHLLSSFPTDGESTFAQQGELLFAQTSWTPHHYEDLIYLNAFLAIDQFTSPARGPLAGGPLGQTGLLFSAPGIGRVGPPINVRTNDTAGASLGYQYFFDKSRQQIVWEFGGQKDTDGTNRGAIATGVRYQRAIGHHWIALMDATTGKQESRNAAASLRFEARAKF